MISKGYKRFTDRLRYFRTDNETIDVIIASKELLKGENSIFVNVEGAKHPILSKRKSNSNSRTLVLNHLRKTVYVSFLKDLYEEVTEYLRYILKEAALNGAEIDRLVGEHNVNMKANDILSLSNKKEIVNVIMTQIFQTLENERSTITLITKIKNKLALDIDKDVISNALSYLETRHIFVHSDGKPNTEFLKKYPFILLDRSNRIQLNYSFIQGAYERVKSLVQSIEQLMVEKNYISASEICRKE